jgi:hypothetical protein
MALKVPKGYPVSPDIEDKRQQRALNVLAQWRNVPLQHWREGMKAHVSPDELRLWVEQPYREWDLQRQQGEMAELQREVAQKQAQRFAKRPTPRVSRRK